MYIRTRSPHYCHRSFAAPHHSWKLYHDVERRRPSSYHRCRVAENDQELRLSLDVPGIKINDLSVKVEDGFLRVSGKREGSPEMTKSFRLDTENIDVDKMEAKLADGVLELKAPKKAKPAACTIPILESTTEDVQEEDIKVAPSYAEAIALSDETDKVDTKENKAEEVVVETVEMEDEAREDTTEGWEEVDSSKKEE